MHGIPFLSLPSNLWSKLDFKNFHVRVDVLNNEWWYVKLLILHPQSLTWNSSSYCLCVLHFLMAHKLIKFCHAIKMFPHGFLTFCAFKNFFSFPLSDIYNLFSFCLSLPCHLCLAFWDSDSVLALPLGFSLQASLWSFPIPQWFGEWHKRCSLERFQTPSHTHACSLPRWAISSLYLETESVWRINLCWPQCCKYKTNSQF